MAAASFVITKRFLLAVTSIRGLVIEKERLPDSHSYYVLFSAHQNRKIKMDALRPHKKVIIS